MNEIKKAYNFINNGQIDEFFEYMEGKVKPQYKAVFAELQNEYISYPQHLLYFYSRLKTFARVSLSSEKLLSSEKYNFLSDEEPTDEQLERLLKNALLDAKQKTQHNTWKPTNPS